jgi:hypothetical protein
MFSQKLQQQQKKTKRSWTEKHNNILLVNAEENALAGNLSAPNHK